jgi:flagellar biosynthesis/type III secretory pathway protein FliH
LINNYASFLQSKLQKKRRAALRQAFNQALEAQEQESDKLSSAIKHKLADAHEFKIDLVITSVKKLIENYLQERPRGIISLAQKVLKNIPEHADAELTANPVDAAILASATHELILGAQGQRSLSILKDENLARGSLVIKANKSIIDAQLSTQLNRARDILLS